MRLLTNAIILIGMMIVVPYIITLTVLQVFSYLIEWALFGKILGTKPWWRNHDKTKESTETHSS